MSSITRAVRHQPLHTIFEGLPAPNGSREARLNQVSAKVSNPEEGSASFALDKTHPPKRVARVVGKPSSSLPHPICQHNSTQAIVAATFPRCNNTCRRGVAPALGLFCYKVRIMTRVSSPHARKSAKFEAYPIHPRCSSQAFLDRKPCSPVLAAHCVYSCVLASTTAYRHLLHHSVNASARQPMSGVHLELIMRASAERDLTDCLQSLGP